MSDAPVSSWYFLALAAGMTLAAFVWVLRPLLTRRAAARAADPAPDPASDGNASAVRPGMARRYALAVAIAVPLLAAALYAWLGDFGALDERRTLDPQTARETLSADALRADLVARIARNPRDGRARVLLARVEFGEDRFAQAAAAFAEAMAVDPRVAKDPEIWCEYADALGMAQNGSLEGRPRELLAQALALDPRHPRALEMAGSAAYEARDFAGAARYWRELLALAPPGSSEQRELAAAIARADLLAASGVR